MSAQTESPPRKSGPAPMLKPVFLPASAVIFGLLILTVVLANLAGDTLGEATTEVNEFITNGVGWWYVIAVNFFLFFSLYLAFSKMGRIRLGRDDERPEFGMVTWFLMLFSAGMGIGLVFFGIAEPLSHYVLPPEAFGNEPESLGGAQDSVGLMMLQWGLHPWGIYAVVGLGLGYMSFRRGRPLAIRWLLEPLIGRKRVEGWIGHTIDTVAIVGTLFGVATSFGFGVSQIIGGLEFFGWAERSGWLIIAIIGGITLIATWSVVSGVHKGLKWLSNFNMSVAALLALVVLLLGPTIFLLQSIPQNAGSYLAQLPETALHVGPFSTDGWEGVWTIAYWGWWTSWAPFVGMFIARISRGRTIREFVVGVLLAPTAASLVWFTIFGNAGIRLQQETGEMAPVDPETGEPAVNSDTALFQYLDSFPSVLPIILGVVAMIVITLFFVTSSDSGSLVIDMLAAGGATETRTSTRVYWAVLEGAAAAALLVVGGSVALTALQTLSISTAAPFSVILVLGCISLFRALRSDVAQMPDYLQVIPPTSVDGQPEQRLHPLSGIRNISATFAGLRSGETPEAAREESPIVPYRQLKPGAVRVDPETGPELATKVRDPLAGEVFDTPEFVSSQEYLNQGGDPQQEEGDPPPRD